MCKDIYGNKHFSHFSLSHVSRFHPDVIYQEAVIDVNIVCWTMPDHWMALYPTYWSFKIHQQDIKTLFHINMPNYMILESLHLWAANKREVA